MDVTSHTQVSSLIVTCELSPRCIKLFVFAKINEEICQEILFVQPKNELT